MKTKEDFARLIIATVRKGSYEDWMSGICKALDEFANQSKWISVEERLPDFDVLVLTYRTIPKDSKTKDEDKFHHYIEIGICESVTQSKTSKSSEWRDRDYNSINPTHWQPLPEIPIQSPPKNNEHE